MQALSKEQKIICQLMSGETVDSLEGIDENLLIEQLRRHRLFPIAEVLLDLLDESSRAELKEQIQICYIKSLHLSSILIEIFGEFTKRGIDAISLKGPVLADTLYGEVVKRSFNDLDILVTRETMWDSIEVLKSMGFKLQYPNENLSDNQWDHYFSYKNEIGLVHKSHKSYIELHVGIYMHELLRKSDDLLLTDDKIEKVIYDSPVKTFNHQNSFLYLVYHGANHLYFRLFWLRDVAEALVKWEINHKSILEKATYLGIDRLLGVSLILCREYCGSEVPEVYDSYLIANQRILKKMFCLCQRRIMGPEDEGTIDKLRRNIYFMLLKPGLKYRWTVFKSLFHRWYIRKYLGGH